MKGPIVGWDIGGANIKAAAIEPAGGAAPIVCEQPFALWRDPSRLRDVLVDIAHRMPAARAMAVTMTAELADCFATKREGVAFVLDALERAFPGVELWIYGVDGAFRTTHAARAAPLDVAAANWMASATIVADTFPEALFIDVGSTTTDIIPIVGGRVAARGRSDPERLQSGELVYTGLLRTPVCAIVHEVPLGGERCRVAAEHFAVAADVYLWLGRIDEREYTCETPDGRGRTRMDAGARLARMVCADLDTIARADLDAIADYVATEQVRSIAAGIRQVLEGLELVSKPDVAQPFRAANAGLTAFAEASAVKKPCATVLKPALASRVPCLAVLAGQGAFLAREAAAEAGLHARDLGSEVGPAAARAAAATAVAYLLAKTLPV